MRLSFSPFRSFGPACLVYLLLFAGTVDAQEWARFRGPNGTGISHAQGIPTTWSSDDFTWKTELPGVGHSSPVLWGDKVFVLSADAETAERYVLCYSAVSGKELWRRTFDSAPHHLHQYSSFASCTPAVDVNHVYIGWSTPTETTLRAFSHSGDEVWDIDLGRWVSQHGFGTSPVLYKELVILHNSQQANKLREGVAPGESTMMAFDRLTGKEVWKTPLVSANVCYSVPFIYEPAGAAAELICTSTGNGIFSLNPLTGSKNWSVGSAFKMRTVGSPILAGGHIFGSTGSGAYAGNYIAAVKPGDSELAYSIKNSGRFKAPYVPCLIAKGDALFCVYDRGFASCVDAPSGKIHWMTRTGAAAIFGSPVRVGDRIYAVDEEGTVWVIAADTKEYRLLAKNSLGEASRSTPAVAGGRIFFRTFSHLICIGGKPNAVGG